MTVTCGSLNLGTLLRFPGGEPHAQVDYFTWPRRLVARLRDFNDLGDLLVYTDAFRRLNGVPPALYLPYFPGARQDRYLTGEAFTAKVYADIINAQGFPSVTVLDPHSDVTPALLNNCYVESAVPYVKAYAASIPGLQGLIVPDLGARKRVEAVGDALGLHVHQAFKHRDRATGKLSGFSCEPLRGRGPYLVVDDICDGGGTFEGLAEEISRHAPKLDQFNLHLWVTHGIFSKGLEGLWKWYATVGTTDSWCREAAGPRLHVHPLEEEK